MLILGGIEPNPGPRFPCGVCGAGVGVNSYKCSGCLLWVHARCSLLPSSRAYTGENSWLCPSCSPQPLSLSAPSPPAPQSQLSPIVPAVQPTPPPTLTPSVGCRHCGETIARRFPPPPIYPPITCPGCSRGFHLKCTDLRATRLLHPDWWCQYSLSDQPQGLPSTAPPAPWSSESSVGPIFPNSGGSFSCWPSLSPSCQLGPSKGC